MEQRLLTRLDPILVVKLYEKIMDYKVITALDLDSFADIFLNHNQHSTIAILVAYMHS